MIEVAELFENVLFRYMNYSDLNHYLKYETSTNFAFKNYSYIFSKD